MSLVSPPAPARQATRGAAALLLTRKLRALDVELAAAIPRVLRGGDDEAIHDLRVAIRRLRTLLKLARPVFGRFHADAVRAAFTRVHRATGALRDEEVLDETLASIACTSPTFVAWTMRRAARERSLRRAVLRGLQGGDLSRARKLLGALVTLPVSPARDRPSAKLARRAIDRARRRVEALRDVKPEDSAGLHELRIAYKELRYSAELLADALPADLAAMSEPASKFQKRLGEIHDADVAIAALRRARGLDADARAQVLEALRSLRDRRVAKFLAEMAPATPEDPVTAVATPSVSSRSGKSRASGARSPEAGGRSRRSASA